MSAAFAFRLDACSAWNRLLHSAFLCIFYFSSILCVELLLLHSELQWLLLLASSSSCSCSLENRLFNMNLSENNFDYCQFFSKSFFWLFFKITNVVLVWHIISSVSLFWAYFNFRTVWKFKNSIYLILILFLLFD